MATKGGTNIAFYVSKFKLEYSNNTRNWTSYRDNEVSRYHSQPQGLLSLLAGEAWARAGPCAQALPAKRVRRSWGRQRRTSTESEPFSLFWRYQICIIKCLFSYMNDSDLPKYMFNQSRPKSAKVLFRLTRVAQKRRGLNSLLPNFQQRRTRYGSLYYGITHTILTPILLSLWF